MATIREEVIEIVREMPGLTLRQIYELMPHTNLGSISSALATLANQGLIESTKVPNPVLANGPKKGQRPQVLTFTYNPDGKPKPRKMRRKTPTSDGLTAQIADLKAKVAELEAWKAAAIERFPELKVSPAILKAREIVANVFLSRADSVKARDVIDGKHDCTAIMCATVAALELAEA